MTSSVPRRVGGRSPGDVFVATDATGEPSPAGAGEPINYGPSRQSTPTFCPLWVGDGSVAPVSGVVPFAGGGLVGVLVSVPVGVVGDVGLVGVVDVSLQNGSMCSVRSNLTA